MEDLILKADETELVSLLNSDAGITLPLPFEQDIFLYGTEIAGTRYRDNIEELYNRLELGDILALVREPDNPYDEYAIRIEIDTDGIPGYDLSQMDPDLKLGYVPRSINKPFARLMDAGKLLYGVVRDKQLITGYHKIIVKIYMRD